MGRTESRARSHSPAKPARAPLHKTALGPTLVAMGADQAVRDPTLSVHKIQSKPTTQTKRRAETRARKQRTATQSHTSSRIQKLSRKEPRGQRMGRSISDFSSSINARDDSPVSKKQPQHSQQPQAKRGLKKQISRSPLISKNSSMISKKSNIKSMKLVSKLKPSNDEKEKFQPGSGSLPTTIKGSVPGQIKSQETKDPSNHKGEMKSLGPPEKTAAQKSKEAQKAQQTPQSGHKKINPTRKSTEKRGASDELKIDAGSAYDDLKQHTENLIKKGHMLYNQQSKDLDVDSFGTISSCDEREIEIMFKGDFPFRFEAQKKIQQDELEAEKRRLQLAETMKKQNSKVKRFVNFLRCRKKKNQVFASKRDKSKDPETKKGTRGFAHTMHMNASQHI